MNASDVTAVVVAWRSSAFLAECLDSLLAQDHPHLTVLAVDNGADEATRQILDDYRARHSDRVRVLATGRNLGFAGGVARALEQVTTPWVFLLNDDAVAAPDVVRLLLAAARASGAVAAQPAVRLARTSAGSSSGTSSGTVNSTGLMVTRDGYGYDRDYLVPWDRRTRDLPPFGASGSAALLDTAAVRAAGGMDAGLFLYYEDTDLAWRLRLAGGEVALDADAVVDHRHAASSGAGSTVFTFHNERNRLLVLARNATTTTWVLQWLRYPMTVASLTVARGPRRASTLTRLRAYAAAIRRLPHVLRLRAHPGPLIARREIQDTFGGSARN